VKNQHVDIFEEGLLNASWMALPYKDFERFRDERIADLAHIYWLLRGCPEGSPEVDWLKAELDIDREILGQMDLGLPA